MKMVVDFDFCGATLVLSFGGGGIIICSSTSSVICCGGSKSSFADPVEGVLSFGFATRGFLTFLGFAGGVLGFTGGASRDGVCVLASISSKFIVFCFNGFIPASIFFPNTLSFLTALPLFGFIIQSSLSVLSGFFINFLPNADVFLTALLVFGFIIQSILI